MSTDLGRELNESSRELPTDDDFPAPSRSRSRRLVRWALVCSPRARLHASIRSKLSVTNSRFRNILDSPDKSPSRRYTICYAFPSKPLRFAPVAKGSGSVSSYRVPQMGNSGDSCSFPKRSKSLRRMVDGRRLELPASSLRTRRSSN